MLLSYLSCVMQARAHKQMSLIQLRPVIGSLHCVCADHLLCRALVGGIIDQNVYPAPFFHCLVHHLPAGCAVIHNCQALQLQGKTQNAVQWVEES